MAILRLADGTTLTAGGMIAAIIALTIYRFLVTFQSRQMEYFTVVGGELELIYRQVWCEPESYSRQPSFNSNPGLSAINIQP